MKMAHEKIRAAVVFVTIFAIVGGVSWALVNAQQTPNQPDQPQTMPKLTIHEQIRDAATAYVARNHQETAKFMNNLSWTGGKARHKASGRRNIHLPSSRMERHDSLPSRGKPHLQHNR